MHNHPSDGGLGWVSPELPLVLILLAAAAAYAAAVRVGRRRGSWPLYRTVSWFTGLACVGAGVVGPVAAAAGTSFTAHMVSHLLLGMIAPLLLVLASPVTVALRALPVARARSLTRFLRTIVLRVLTHPVPAAALNVGGLWLLYTTDFYQLMRASMLLHLLVHTHIFVSGYVFTASLVGVDPKPHPTPMWLRSVVLVIFIAAHSILAKWVYAHPPVGVVPGDARAGAQLMYYGGDVVHVVLIVLLFAGWFRATRPRRSTSFLRRAS